MTMAGRSIASVSLVATLCLSTAGPALASPVELGGFVQANYAVRATNDPCASSATACDLMLGDERVQLKAEGSSPQRQSAFSAKVDAFHDAVTGRADIEVREAFVDVVTRYFSLRAGRQIITWGVGDLLFANDIYPKDWVAFFTGRPLEYLKIGSDALKGDFHLSIFDLEVVLTPFFQSDRYPTSERLLLPDPFPGLARQVEDKPRSFANMEVSAKLSRYIGDWELAAYAARTFYRAPAMALDDPTAPSAVVMSFPRLNTFGASATGALLGGVLALEGVYQDSTQDRQGSNPAIENSLLKGLIGYSYPLWTDATLGVQSYVEWMLDYDEYRGALPPGSPVRSERRFLPTLRFMQLLWNQTLTVNLFAFVGITERDVYLIPSVRYAVTDELWAELGGNVFLGRKNDTLFGMLENNTNVYATMRVSF